MSGYAESKPKYSLVDLFAGAGGLSYGFLQTGRFEVKAAFELNPEARETYHRNHGDQTVLYSDVEEALSSKVKARLGEIDVVIGGPPCQGFSNANRQKNYVINKNNYLMKKFVQAILNLKPKAFLMENVSMLKSDVHRFYVDDSDQAMIEQYGISVAPAEILLLDSRFLFYGAVDILQSREKIVECLWEDQDYFLLNVVYKTRKNKEKLKIVLKKHQKRLLALAERLLSRGNSNAHLAQCNRFVRDAIHRYFADAQTESKATALCSLIEPAIMVQRMLSKAMEIHDNHIVVTEYATDRGLVARVTSMAVMDYVESVLGAKSNGYKIVKEVLSAAAFGVPQKRRRYVVMGVREAIAQELELPVGTFTEDRFRTVGDAIKDIENIHVFIGVREGNSGIELPKTPEAICELGRQLRDSGVLYNHVSTNTTPQVLERFKAIPQGGNFHSLPLELKTSYSNTERTQKTIYLRLKYSEPSGTVVNVRKSMWIHPTHDRALSIREAARLQTFPDSFIFCGNKDSQYQQIGNAVPPMLAKALAEHLCKYLDGYSF